MEQRAGRSSQGGVARPHDVQRHDQPLAVRVRPTLFVRSRSRASTAPTRSWWRTHVERLHSRHGQRKQPTRLRATPIEGESRGQRRSPRPIRCPARRQAATLDGTCAGFRTITPRCAGAWERGKAQDIDPPAQREGRIVLRGPGPVEHGPSRRSKTTGWSRCRGGLPVPVLKLAATLTHHVARTGWSTAPRRSA